MENQNVKANLSVLEAWHVETENWKSDVEFYHHEMNFLRDLVGGHFMQIVNKESLPTIQKMMSDIRALEHKREVLTRALDQHRMHLEDQITLPETINSPLGEQGQISIKEKMRDFATLSKVVKAEVFQILTHVKSHETPQQVFQA